MPVVEKVVGSSVVPSDIVSSRPTVQPDIESRPETGVRTSNDIACVGNSDYLRGTLKSGFGHIQSVGVIGNRTSPVPIVAVASPKAVIGIVEVPRIKWPLAGIGVTRHSAAVPTTAAGAFEHLYVLDIGLDEPHPPIT